MITTLALLASSTFNSFYLYPNHPQVNSYSLVTVSRMQTDNYQLNYLTNHLGEVCGKQMVTRSQLDMLVPFRYGERVYTDLGYSTRSGTVVGTVNSNVIVRYEGGECREYATLVPTAAIIPLN